MSSFSLSTDPVKYLIAIDMRDTRSPGVETYEKETFLTKKMGWSYTLPNCTVLLQKKSLERFLNGNLAEPVDLNELTQEEVAKKIEQIAKKAAYQGSPAGTQIIKLLKLLDKKPIPSGVSIYNNRVACVIPERWIYRFPTIDETIPFEKKALEQYLNENLDEEIDLDDLSENEVFNKINKSYSLETPEDSSEEPEALDASLLGQEPSVPTLPDDLLLEEEAEAAAPAEDLVLQNPTDNESPLEEAQKEASTAEQEPATDAEVLENIELGEPLAPALSDDSLLLQEETEEKASTKDLPAQGEAPQEEIQEPSSGEDPSSSSVVQLDDSSETVTASVATPEEEVSATPKDEKKTLAPTIAGLTLKGKFHIDRLRDFKSNHSDLYKLIKKNNVQDMQATCCQLMGKIANSGKPVSSTRGYKGTTEGLLQDVESYSDKRSAADTKLVNFLKVLIKGGANTRKSRS